MRIALVQASTWLPAHGGAPIANRALLEGLAARGHQVRALVPATAHHGPRDRAALLDALRPRGIEPLGEDAEHIRFAAAGVEVRAAWDGARLERFVRSHLAETKPDWVLVSSEDPAQRLLAAALDARPTRVVYIAHTTLQLPFGPDAFLTGETRARALRRVAGTLTVSEYLRDYLARWGEIPATLARFPVYGDGPWGHGAGFGAGEVTMINPCAVKGLDIFLGLAEAFPEVPFAAVPTWGTTGADRARLAARPNLRLLDPADDIDEIFVRTRILVVPSLWGEAFGQIAVEAMLRGIPVLASRVGGLGEAKLGVDYSLPVRPIEAFEDRLDDRRVPVPVIPPQDLAPWIDALGALLADRALHDKLSADSRAAAEGFAAGLDVEPFERFLEQLAPAEIDPSRAEPDLPARDGALDGDPRLAGLSPEKRALLALRLRRKGRGESGGAP